MDLRTSPVAADWKMRFSESIVVGTCDHSSKPQSWIFELFNLINDPLEQDDISNDFPEIVTKMENILQNYLKEEIKSDSQKLDKNEREKVEEELKKLGYL